VRQGTRMMLAAVAAMCALPAADLKFTGRCREGKPMLPGPAPTPIDAFCGERGDPKAAPYLVAENLAKNNFCVVNWPPEQKTFKDMLALEERSPNTPPGRDRSIDRSIFAKLGEGATVQMRGYILAARQSGPESVNCGSAVPPGRDYSDIHIPLVEQPGQDECSAIVVEMSPHYRPAAWNTSVLKRVAGMNIPVRVTGQLFFDGAHRACEKGQRLAGEAPRASRWEIHPVVKFEVCPSRNCGDSGWLTLESFGSYSAK
jgi:hypothetical protein